MKTNIKRNIILKAIKMVNKEKGYHIELNRDEIKGSYYYFTLKCKPGIPGAKISRRGRRLAKVSWEAHGDVFDKIFDLVPDSFIITMGNKITKEYKDGVM